VAFGPDDGIVAAVGSEDGTIRLWNAASGDALGAPLQGATTLRFFGVAISKELLLVSAGDGIRLWDMWDVAEACRLAAQFVSPSQVAQYMPAGERIHACDQPG
jgi:WD40 repeat protein